jgi:hypothetical protein
MPGQGMSRPTSGRPAATRPSAPGAREPARFRAAVASEPGGPTVGSASRAGPGDDDEAALDTDEDLRADMDWTAFWRWARRKGYDNRDAIERAIGQPIRGRTPKELRTLLLNLETDASHDE